MKCIKAIKQSKEVELGEIRRVDDKTAFNMVGPSWMYISKSEWKKSKGVKKSESNDSVVEETKKKKNEKQMDGTPSEEPFVKTRKNKSNKKDS